MKSKKIVIIIGVLLSLFIGVFVGAYFFAKSYVTPEKVHKTALTILHKTFPKSKIVLGRTDIDFGLSVSINIESLSISGPKYDLASFNKLKIHLPIFSIITGGGDLTVLLNEPTLHYIETRRSNNWSLALAKTKTKTKTKGKASKKAKGTKKKLTSEEEISLGLPVFLINSTVSLEIKNLLVKYRLKDKSKGSIKLEKVLFKKLGLRNSSAYEINSKLDYKLASKETVQLNALLIGQFNLSEFISKQTLEMVSVLKISNLKLPGIKNKLPEVKTEIQSVVNAKGDLNLNLSTTFLDKNNISFDLTIKKGAINLSNLKTELLLKDLMGIAALNIKSIDAKTSKLVLNGSLKISKKGRITPALNFSLGPNLTFVDKNFTTETTLNGSLKGKSFKAKAEAKVLDGTIVVQNAMKLDLNNPPSATNLPASRTLINIQNLTVSEGLIQGLLYPEKDYSKNKKNTKNAEKSGKSDKKITSDKQPRDLPVIPPGEITVKMSNVKIDKKPFNLQSKIILTSRAIALKKSSFSYSNGKGEVEALIKLSQSKTSGSFKFNLTNLDLEGLKPFLPKNVLKAIKGNFSGKTSGTFSSSEKSTSYDVVSNIKARNGEIEGVNIGDYLKPILNSIPKLGKKYSNKEFDIDGKFETCSMNGRFTEKLYTIKTFHFLGLNKKLDLKGNGKLSPNPKGNSVMFVTYHDLTGKISKVLKKELGTEKLPLKLVGKGFSLKPDLDYTLKKVSKTAVKTQAKKQFKKFMKEDGSKKLKKLFKGLFQ
ncbi:hypothetical protein A9Q84_21720 [Halobacteriovorax marinus]|uniref:AsmA domain-containing protein n=1 Tax=Halobacteriovorax marinus TaxID=97084 RepID=A0A1Y5F8A6_9BACT|nr:hypothetical protein A9Q84_21720 [Halobacteriovorax marinus]